MQSNPLADPDEQLQISPSFWTGHLWGFWLICLKSQWAYLIINHKLCTICLWTHSDGAHLWQYTLPLHAPTHPYLPHPPLHHHPPLPPPTSTTPFHYQPLLPPTTHLYYPLLPLIPTTNNGLERNQFKDNIKHGLESDWFCQWLVMCKCGAGAGDGSKHYHSTLPPHPNRHPILTLKPNIFFHILSTSTPISCKPS